MFAELNADPKTDPKTSSGESLTQVSWLVCCGRRVPAEFLHGTLLGTVSRRATFNVCCRVSPENFRHVL